MTKTRIQLIIIVLLIIFFVVLSVFFRKNSNNISEEEYGQYENKYDKKVEVISDKNEDGTYSLNFSNNKWKYDKENDVYYQIGIAYCISPENVDYQCLSIYVPGKFLNGNDNQNGTYTCTPNLEAQVGEYNVKTAPIVIPVNTAGYSAQKSTTFYEFDGLKEYLDAGLIYVYAGCRGINEVGTKTSGTAPWGVTDLKAAIRYLRYNSDVMVGNTNKIIMFGHAEGGSQTAIVGTSGNSDLYLPYLRQIGAAMTDKSGKSISDEISGAMCWSPDIISEMADAAYEWNIGQYIGVNTREIGTFTKALSNDLSIEYAKYINSLNLRDENGKILQLSESENNIYTNGTYYEYVKQVINNSLNTFIHETTFPQIIEVASQDDGNFPGGNRRKKDTSSKKTKKYASIKEYIDTHNKNKAWIVYDENTNSANITSIQDFVNNCKKVNKDVGAYDSFGKTQIYNRLFGVNDNKAIHFNKTMSDLLNENTKEYSKLKKWSKTYPTLYSEDLFVLDMLKTNVETRLNMYSPLFYLVNDNSSNVAKHWRINSGINQSNTPNVSEINMVLLLRSNRDVSSVNYTTVWEQEHSMAERNGNAISNFISWVNSCK